MELQFEGASGLLPAVVQDAARGDVLMLAWMNREAYEQTLASGYVTFYSRSRRKLWVKGETSGNRLRVVELRADCDRDAVLARVEVEGDGVACHNGTRTCFTNVWRGTPLGCAERPAYARVAGDPRAPQPAGTTVVEGGR